jgi:transcriptional regulator with XRE-family HTH domain
MSNTGSLLEALTARKTQVVVAAAAGVSQSVVSSWQTGRHLPTRTRLPSLAAALGIPLADLTAAVESDRAERFRLARLPKPGRRKAASAIGRGSRRQVAGRGVA